MDDALRLLEQSATALLVLVGDRIHYTNRVAARMLGFDTQGPDGLAGPNGLVGTELLAHVHPDHRPSLDGRLDGPLDEHRLLQTLVSRPLPVQLVTCDGSLRDVQLSAEPVFFDGQPTVALLARDQTAEMQAIRALNARTGLLMDVLDRMVDAVLLLAEDGTIEGANKAASTLFAVDPVSLHGRSILHLLGFSLTGTPGAPDPLTAIARRFGSYAIGSGQPVELARIDGSTFWAELSLTRFDDRHHAALLVRDVTRRTRMEKRLARLALYDQITGLANRVHLLQALEGVIHSAIDPRDRIVVVGIDIDRFKQVNDHFGHALGDQLLRAIGGRLSADLEPGDLLARVSGDEFVLAAATQDVPATLDRLRTRVEEAFGRTFMIEDVEIFVHASAGVVIWPDHAQDPAQILKNVEGATYLAKEAGRNSWQMCTPEVTARRAGRLTLETELRRAIEKGGLHLAYQPRVDARTNRVLGFEALVRWDHPSEGSIPPSRFIPVAEDSGLIVPLGRWVLEEACAALRRFHDHGFEAMSLSVNLSVRQMHDAALLNRVRAALDRVGLVRPRLELEVTESGLMHDVDRSIRILRDLRALGLSIAVDDFGTGYSSLNYLRHLPLDVLKIDRSFIAGIPGGEGETAIASAIIALAKSLRLTTVAEGVETQSQRDVLMVLGCDEMQGHLFSPAVCEGAALELLMP